MIRQKEGQDKSLYESYAKTKKCCQALIYLCDDKKIGNDQFDYRRRENGKHCRIIAVSIEKEQNMRYLTFALTKGRLAGKTMKMLEQSWYYL